METASRFTTSDHANHDEIFVSAETRAIPLQDRAVGSVNAILDAAAATIDEIGADRVTTSEVAQRAGVSIGTLYRYLPDRIAMLDALRRREMTGYRNRLLDDLRDQPPTTLRGAAERAALLLRHLYEARPGFRITGTVSTFANGSTQQDSFDRMLFARDVLALVTNTRGVPLHAAAWRLEAALSLAHSLIARAYESSTQPSAIYLRECDAILDAYLGGVHA